ncbi:winged helix DNA-binding domain-containing protein [Massilia sp. PAMC28688]|uniref:winged helix-turn-helix domain-containing protein n=1 Tax=Massilia sp. PAMC28688 TaxID=2861283 RepID=UPI001C625EBE|nr:crosslink repair DNA glycosylase YcaQ family protein [Massilia sp. PAMC28688]QYF92541.1 winged helix DNA-binding domain-containing protein [Massilia sp. PAMC28688]
MTELTLTPAQARALHLAAQGMLQPRRSKARKDDVLAAIRRMGVLQIDTISVVARSPYLVLWSRLGDYEPAWLDQHLAEGRLFEYWAHEACFVPIEDYGLLRHRMLDPAAMGWKYSASWMRERAAEVAAVLSHIRTSGPTRSADLGRSNGQAGGWWDWKPEKRSLEVLFTSGALMIARRHNFQRVYDLAERVLPSWDDSQLPSMEDVRRRLALQAVRALGVSKAAWVADYYRTRKPHADLAALVEEGCLLRAAVQGWDEPVYVHRDHADLALRAAGGALTPTLTSVLSPFDPIVWDRRRALELFNFDYRLECYTPAARRRYGYFTLPILRRGALVGRVDAKAHRRQGIFDIISLELDAGVRASERLAADIAQALARCARWHGCPELRITRTVPALFGPMLEAAL